MFLNDKKVIYCDNFLQRRVFLYCFSEQASAPRGFGIVLRTYFSFTSIAHRGLITAKTTFGCVICGNICWFTSRFFYYFPRKISWKSSTWTWTDISKSRNVLLSSALFLRCGESFVFTSSVDTVGQVQRSLLYSEIKLDFLTVSHERAAKWNLKN